MPLKATPKGQISPKAMPDGWSPKGKEKGLKQKRGKKTNKDEMMKIQKDKGTKRVKGQGKKRERTFVRQKGTKIQKDEMMKIREDKRTNRVKGQGKRRDRKSQLMQSQQV